MKRKDFIKSSLLALIGLPLLGIPKKETPVKWMKGDISLIEPGEQIDWPVGSWDYPDPGIVSIGFEDPETGEYTDLGVCTEDDITFSNEAFNLDDLNKAGESLKRFGKK